MRIATETSVEVCHLLVEHRVFGYTAFEIFESRFVRKLAIEQEIAYFEKTAFLSKLVDRVTSIKKFSLVTVNIGDRRTSCCSRCEAGIISELPSLLK